MEADSTCDVSPECRLNERKGTTKARKGRAARTKGAGGEREVSGILSDAFGIIVKRKLGQARDGGDDIQIGKFRLEIKRRERISIDEWSKQVESAAGIGEIPVVVYRRSREPWRVSLLLSDFIPLMGNEID